MNAAQHDSQSSQRLKIAFLDYPDVFEDFYSHYGVDHQTFATKWHNTGSHAWLKIIQQEIGDVTWYALSIKPTLTVASTHEYIKANVKFLPSSWLHRRLWKLFYVSKFSWRLKKYYKTYAALAAYTAPLSWKVFSEIKRDRPDVILVQEYSSGKFDVLCLYAKLLGLPLFTYHAGSTENDYSGKFLRRFTIKKAAWIYASGVKELNRLEQDWKVASSRLNIIRPPIDLNIYKPMPREETCREAGLKSTRRYWIFVGRLDDGIKRVSAIIKMFCKAAENHADLDLLIVGVGNDEMKLKSLVLENFSERVLFLGWVADDYKKAVLYNCSECLLMASVREGFPTVIGEAFACGVPAVCSDVGTIADLVIPGKTGWLFAANDDAAMLAIYKSIAENADELFSIRSSLREVAEKNVSFEATALALKEGFEKVMGKKK